MAEEEIQRYKKNVSKGEKERYLGVAFAPAMQGDSPEVRGLCLPKIHYFIFDYIVLADKMAELFFNFGRFLAD